MKKQLLLWSSFLMLGASIIIACTDDSENTDPTPKPTPGLDLDTCELDASIDLTADAQQFTVKTKTNMDYVINVNSDWVSVVNSGRSVNEYTITLAVKENYGAARSTQADVLYVGQKFDTLTLTINQAAGGDVFELAVDTAKISKEAQDVTFTTRTNATTYTVNSNSEWLTVYDQGRADEYTITLKAAANTGVPRTGLVTINYTGHVSDTSFVYTVIQEAGDLKFASSFSEWPEYTNAPYYNFLDEVTDFQMPTKNINTSSIFNFRDTIKWTVEDDYWVFFGGYKKKSVVTENAVKPMLREYNRQFNYLRDKMGWPPDKAVQDGYRSMILLYGSGLKSDNVDSTALGGWQSAIGGYPCVLMSYYPVYCFDPNCKYTDKAYQTGAAIHEGIHAVFATLPGCKDAAWFHEGANTWLQGQLNLEMDMEAGTANLDKTEFGWLCMGSILAPFIPIESYGGWLADDNSFAGPAAQGNNGDNCRYKLGGLQYSSVFPTFMSVAMSKYSVAKIWQTAFSGYILDRLEDFVGPDQIVRMIMEYRARLCLVDMNEWNGAVKNMYNSNWNTSIKPENSKYVNTQKAWNSVPYAKTTIDSTGWYVPDAYTLPGWSGANIIPFIVNSDTIAFSFKNLSNKPMKFMVCYNTKEGKPVYSEYVDDTNDFILDLSNDKPANNAIFVIACNTNYKYTGDAQRKEKYDFRIKPLFGIEKKAAISKKWWNYSATL